MSKDPTKANRLSLSGSTLFSRTSSLGNEDVMYDEIGPFGLNLLFTPSDPTIDFIFVHGLGGGSKKSWSKTSFPSHYWPREWLPKDPAFKDVRVHSFGYNSQWTKGRDIRINMHDFAKSLLGEIATSPSLNYRDVGFIRA